MAGVKAGFAPCFFGCSGCACRDPNVVVSDLWNAAEVVGVVDGIAGRSGGSASQNGVSPPPNVRRWTHFNTTHA